MPRHTEPSANNALGGLLQPMLGRASVRSENTRAIAGHPGLRPDILITAPGRSPVVVESEYEPALTAEAEARSRLGLEATEGGRTIEAAIALRFPDDVGDAEDLQGAVAAAAMSYCVFTVEQYSPPPNSQIQSVARFPESGWLEGSVSDLADLIRLVSVPQLAIDTAATALQEGISDTANILDELDQTRPGITREIAGLLGMENVPQTRRMACAIIANAMIFHERIAGMHDGISPLRSVCGPDVEDPQDKVLSAWAGILEINYWPIFAIGKDILERLPPDIALRALHRLRITAGRVNGTGVNNAHDLTGRVFQRLISDRKYLATFYTLPASAALLARLAVAKLRNPSPPAGEGQGEGEFDWADAGAIGKLRVGDFACGTGALLSAVYEQIAARHENAGGDPAAIHPAMMEEVLYGCDVMPSAIHITGSTLSGIQPNIGFGQSRLYTMPYGRQQDGTVKIGSLELLQSSQAMTLFNTSDPALRTGSAGEETAAHVNVEVLDEGFDLVIMNPPFTTNTGNEGSRLGTFNATFAAFNASDEDQRAMGKRLSTFAKGTVYHGNAGIASAFSALGNRKLKPGGVLALVLPLTATMGLSWQEFRHMVSENYVDISVLSIAANGHDMSFSSDTSMAECLIIARKCEARDSVDRRAHFTSLNRRPLGFASSSAIAKNHGSISPVRQIEDGPYGGTPLLVGGEHSGEMLAAPCSSLSWGNVRLSDSSLAQVAHALSNSKLWLPGIAIAAVLDISLLNEVGKVGLVHHDINGPLPRGPFSKVAASPTATYPCLWNHDAKSEARIVCTPDSQLQVRQGMEEKAEVVWATACRAHINRDFTFGSQALAVAFTERDSVGGRVWPNVIFEDARFDYVFSVWGNGTLGLLSYWWHSSRQQSSKAGMTIRQAETMPVLDFRVLSDAQLATAELIFDEFRELDLVPAYLPDADANRALLDRRVVCDLLGFDEDVYRGVRRLAAKWCAEPSVHGGKQRPRGARLAV